VERYKHFDKLHWEINFVVFGGIIAITLFLFGEAVKYPQSLEKYVFSIAVLDTGLLWISLFIHLYFGRYTRAELAFQNEFEKHMNSDESVHLTRFQRGHILYREDTIWHFSSITYWSIDFMLAYAAMAASLLLLFVMVPATGPKAGLPSLFQKLLDNVWWVGASLAVTYIFLSGFVSRKVLKWWRETWRGRRKIEFTPTQCIIVASVLLIIIELVMLAAWLVPWLGAGTPSLTSTPFGYVWLVGTSLAIVYFFLSVFVSRKVGMWCLIIRNGRCE